MISIELIFPVQQKRVCVRVNETTHVGEFKRYLARFYKVKYDCILMLSNNKNVTDEMTLSEAGMFTGSGVVIDDG